ncbi:helix-turn-helix domain-containing protein [Wenjunlia vitaminophila]|uniref:helix-turn-helix domain-containing protein n=1 Tax=Wenjunlia vitaminophila TaxID=76728 RepID=UPI0003650546|nr:helix-turn-helix transcriptional regulator [Wenjunlia vitaminophila]
MRLNGPAVRELRRARNVGLRQLADQIGRNRGYLSRLERDLVREPADEVVHLLAEALAVPVIAITRDIPKESP